MGCSSSKAKILYMRKFQLEVKVLVEFDQNESIYIFFHDTFGFVKNSKPKKFLHLIIFHGICYTFLRSPEETFS